MAVKSGIRDYTPGDYSACRQLWVELTEHHRHIYDDPQIGGDDPGTGFDDYLLIPERVGSWVAEMNGDVVGFTGLFDHGTSGELEPIVVTSARRHQGIGRALIDHVVQEATHRGFEYLAIRPVARNLTAMRSFWESGFRTLGGHIDMTMDLTDRRHGWLEHAELHGLTFRY